MLVVQLDISKCTKHESQAHHLGIPVSFVSTKRTTKAPDHKTTQETMKLYSQQQFKLRKAGPAAERLG